jgi:hypothetical protein
MVGHQPQHAARHLFEDAHPGVEDLLGDLEAAVERAEHEGVFRQRAGRARGRRADQALAVVDLEGMRHAQRFFGEVRLPARAAARTGRRSRSRRRAARSGRGSPARSPAPARAGRPGCRPRAQRQAVQVDQDVDLVLADAARGLLVGHAADADVVVHRRRPRARAAACRPRGSREGVHLDACAVVQLVQLGRQDRHRVRDRSRRQVADAQLARGRSLPLLIGASRRSALSRARSAAPRPAARRVVRGAQHRQRGRAGVQLLLRRPGIDLYIGQAHCFWRRCTQCVITLTCAGSSIRLRSSASSASGIARPFFEQAADIVQRLDMQRAVAWGAGLDVAGHFAPQGQRLVELLALFEQRAQIQVRLDEIGLDGDAPGGSTAARPAASACARNDGRGRWPLRLRCC